MLTELSKIISKANATGSTRPLGAEMAIAWVVIRHGSFLRLNGPFAYASWFGDPRQATPLPKSHASAWAEVYGGRAVAASLFSGVGDVQVKEAPITERVPATKRDGTTFAGGFVPHDDDDDYSGGGD